MNTRNLIKNEDLTPSERRKRASKAGKASVAARRRRKSIRELLEVALEMECSDGKTNAEAVVASMIAAAREGDVKAFVAIRDTVGEKPTTKIQVGLADDLDAQLGRIPDGDEP